MRRTNRQPRQPRRLALRALHAWLDNWRGVGLIVEGMRRQGYRVSLREIGRERVGSCWPRRAVARRFRRLLGTAKLPRFRLYDLRHSYATHHLATGTPITYVADQLGHAKPTTTLSFYAHWLPTAERAWAARLERVRTGRIPNGIHNSVLEESAARDSERRASAV